MITTVAKPGIFIGCPCYGGQVQTGYFQSILRLVNEANKENIPLALGLTERESLITRGRNYLIGRFLLPEYKHCDRFLFIDTDITFQAADILSLYNHCCSISDMNCDLSNTKWPVVGGIYPKKGLNLDRLRTMFSDPHPMAQRLPPNIILARALDYVVNVKLPGAWTEEQKTKGSLMVPSVDGYVPVDEIGTGMLMFHRSVLERMIAETEKPIAVQHELFHRVKKYTNDTNGTDVKETYSFFDQSIERTPGMDGYRYLSEDWAFCGLCKALGIPIYASMCMNLTHTGAFNFDGAFGLAHTLLDQLLMTESNTTTVRAPPEPNTTPPLSANPEQGRKC